MRNPSRVVVFALIAGVPIETTMDIDDFLHAGQEDGKQE